MALRDLVGVALVGAAGWALLRTYQLGSTPLPVAPPAGDPAGDYQAKLAAAENARRDPLAKAATSSASGLWQFTKATWQRLGGQWGADLTKAFGGLAPSIAEQNARLAMLTSQNAAILQAAGIAVTDAALYAAHFLGAPVAVRVLQADNGAQLAPLIGSAAMVANRFASTMTVGQFRDWLARKMGS